MSGCVAKISLGKEYERESGKLQMGQKEVMRVTLLTPLTPTLIPKKMSLTLGCLEEMGKVSAEMKIR